MHRFRSLLAGVLLALPALPVSAPAGGMVYGYEDSLGMLHTSTTKRNAHYKPLYEGRVDHDTLVRLLREKDAMGGPPVRALGPGLVDLGTLPEAGKRLLELARPFMDAPYRLGGDTPAGIDCSGLTRAVFARLGCRLPRQSRLQAGVGKPVAASELAPGDLLFFSTNREIGINHVGIYLGGGRMLHSSSMRGGVGVDRLPGSRYAAWFVTARRLSGLAGGERRSPPGLVVSGK